MLKVNEVYGPVQQGEGKSLGLEVMFIRLSLCVLHCDWCDTPYTWNWLGTSFKHPQKFDKAKEIHPMSDEEIFRHLSEKSRTVKSIVLSGGEPLIQQKRLISLLQLLKRNSYWIEVETAGTVEPTDEFISLVDQINCSPKISNSGNSVQEREKPYALTKIVESGKANFKFVVSSPQDLPEILDLVVKYNMRDIYLMPEGRSPNEILEHEIIAKQLCEKYGWNFTTRLHILKYGNVRGV